MSKEKLIPELRFPEFQNEGEWFGDTLINIAKFRRGSFPQPYGLPEWYDDVSGMPFIQVYDVGDNFRLKPKTKSKISKLAAEQSVFIPKGTVIITIQGSIGRVALTQYDAYIDRTLLLFEEFYNEVDKTFFAYVLFMLFEIEKLKAPGGIIKTITKEVLSDFVINIPQLPEQQKIASCLSSLDNLIAAHSQKLELLKDHKKGLMQNLFPQAGETVPKYRFKEFEKDGEWVEKKLGDKEVSFFVNEKIIINKISVENYISTENMLPDYSGISIASKIPSSGNFTKFKIGDILISNIRPYLKKVWKSDKIGGASNDVLVFRSGLEVLNEFLEFIIKNDEFINYVMDSAKGVKMPRGDKDSMQKYVVFIPSKDEQQKIASCLSSLDALITAQAEKIEQLKLHKKGLMQGLFPKIMTN